MNKKEWLYNIENIPNFERKTYDELKQLVETNGLKENRKYLLTDYRTKYQQPTTLVIKEMEVEQLVLTANSTNSFEPIVSSPTYPQDVIYYNFNDNKCEDTTTDRTGFIQRRTDTITKNDCPQDWRTMLWARYKPDASQYYKDSVLTNYSVWTSGNAFIDRIYKSGNSLYMAKNTNVPTSPTDSSVFYQVYEDINVGMLIEEKTKIADKFELKKGELHERLTFGNDCFSNFIGGTNELHKNVFGDNCKFNILSTKSISNTFGSECIWNVLNNGNFRNIIFSNCDYNSFGNRCYENILAYDCDKNSFGNNCYKNTLASNCTSNSFGNHCFSNVFGYNCVDNSFGNHCYSNVFGYSCAANSFGNHCYSNVFGMVMWYANVEVLVNKNTSNITIISSIIPKTITYTADGKYIYWYLNSSNQPVYTVIP